MPALAIALDLFAGEPPTPIHPTAWMGRGLARARAAHGRGQYSPAASLVAGAATLGTGVFAAAALGRLAGRLAARVPDPALRAVIGAALLKPSFSVRALLAAGREVEEALRRDALPDARRLLAWHLVSRDTARLTASEVAGAAIESLAENLGDGVVAPLLAYAAGGLGAAYAYRLVNTADAMLGYRTPELEWFGKPAARIDDLLNIVPARLSAVLIAAATGLAGGSAERAWQVARADAAHTPSPNAGWPMAAMAGALDVRLDKQQDTPGTPLYVLHAAGRAPSVDDLAHARRIVAVAAGLAAVLAMALARPRRVERA